MIFLRSLSLILESCGVQRVKNCSFYNELEQKSLNIPVSYLVLPCISPHVIVADNAFAMSSHLVKPCAQNHLTKEKRIFNYRLSRAQRVVENTFGILANCFRVFMTPIALCPEKVEVITLTCCILHNHLWNK